MLQISLLSVEFSEKNEVNPHSFARGWPKNKFILKYYTMHTWTYELLEQKEDNQL
jgi:hypothetical protein